MRAGRARGGAAMGLLAGKGRRRRIVIVRRRTTTTCVDGVVVVGAARRGHLRAGAEVQRVELGPDVRRHQATVFCYIGELCRYLLAAEPSADDRDHAVRAVIGNGLRPDIWDGVRRRTASSASALHGAMGGPIFVNGFNMDRTAGFCPLPFAVVDCDPETVEAPVSDEQRMEVGKGEVVGSLLNSLPDFAPFEGYTDRRASEALFRGGVQKGRLLSIPAIWCVARACATSPSSTASARSSRRKGENVATTQVENAPDRSSGDRGIGGLRRRGAA